MSNEMRSAAPSTRACAVPRNESSLHAPNRMALGTPYRRERNERHLCNQPILQLMSDRQSDLTSQSDPEKCSQPCRHATSRTGCS